MKASFTQHNTKRVIAGLLAIWLSGVVVLFCCEMPSVNAANDEIESCPLAKKGDCSKSSVSDSGEFFGQIPFSFDCCSVPAKIFDKVRTFENSKSLATVESVKVPASQFFLFEKTFRASEFHRSFVRHSGSIYLRNRVLRI